MSLFKTREFWSTHSEDDEYFDQNSLIVTKLNSNSDYILTGSQSGVLRIFKPVCELNDNNNLSGYDVGDLVMEKIFTDPILQIGCGKLVSGSQNVQVAVLHPKLLSVYFLTNKEGVTEHGLKVYSLGTLNYNFNYFLKGTQYILKLMYEHKLRRLAYNFVIGPFGGNHNRDFICVQSIDGILTVFEQETLAFNCALSEFLIPAPLAYVRKTDSFLTLSSNWQLENYKYKTLCEIASNSAGADSNKSDDDKKEMENKKSLKCDWSYNIGESIIDINVVEDSISRELWIMILGERNLFCLNDIGRLKFMKKLDYSPFCFSCYALDNKVMSLVVAETETLLIYQNTSLKWSAHLHFLPVAVRRIFLDNIKGAMTFLSEEGHLQCCYLGTEPSLFVAPPLNMKEVDFEKAAEELSRLNKTIKSSYNNDLKMDKSTAEKELQINVSVSPHLEDCPDPIYNGQKMCSVSIDVIPASLFEQLQITVGVQQPLKAVPEMELFRNLSDKKQLKCHIYAASSHTVASLKVQVAASFISNMGIPKTLAKTAMLPLKLALETCQPLKECEHKITLNLNYPPVPLATLFSEFIGENSLNQTTSAIGFKSVIEEESNKEKEVVTILLAKSSERYRLQSNCFASLNLLIEQMIHRLAKLHYASKSDFKLTFSSSSSLANELQFYINQHFNVRQRLNSIQEELSKLSSQFRLIQKRLIAKFKVKNPTPLTSMEVLLDDTYSDIMKNCDDLISELENLHESQNNLNCALNVVCNLLELMDIDKDLKELVRAAFCPQVNDLETQSWEDVFDASLCYLLRTVLAKSEKDKLRIAQTSFDEVKDIGKVEKHLNQVLERLPKIGSILDDNKAIKEDILKDEEVKEEEEDNKQLIPVGSQLGESSTRLLSARKPLLERRNRIELN